MKKGLSCLFGFLSAVFMAGAAHAFCPVCTVAVGAGLEGARVLGVDDVITGLWAGGLMLSLSAWTANYMATHGIKNRFLYLLNYVVYYGLLALIYVLPVGNPTLRFNATTLWGVDSFLLGVIVGSIVFWLAGKWYQNIKAKNGGHAWFPFQKVVWPLGALLIVTLIFWFIIK
ncbi:MAG: hypothetical protein IJ866_00600 [Alphaproteobacteria bacterium]|nr:hypothetical protein [Alphaproteobacteria bacterium]